MAVTFLKTKIEGMSFSAEKVLLFIDVFVKKTQFVRILKITFAPNCRAKRSFMQRIIGLFAIKCTSPSPPLVVLKTLGLFTTFTFQKSNCTQG